MKISIVIPNWNGKKLLEKNLPLVFKALPKKAEIIIIDNGSTDGSVEEIKNLKLKMKNCNLKLKIILNKTNLGFARAVNQGVKKARGDLVVLLNNDVIPEKGFLQKCLNHFEDLKVFAVSFNEQNWSWAKIKWANGFIEHESGSKTDKVHFSGWASGGSAVFRKSIWEKLGGLDEIYSPFYWEDVDLSYRAWKRDYKILWEPKAVVCHKHEETIKRFPKNYINFISRRNQLLFIWKNITNSKMILEHKFWLWKKLLTTPGYWKPYLAALSKLFQILPKRFKERKEVKISDREIFKMFSQKD